MGLWRWGADGVRRRSVRVARAERNVREARRAASRDRTARLLVQLVGAVEQDIAAAERSGDPHEVIRSPAGAALCRSLWGHRNLFATTWHVYCEDDERWIADLRASGDLFRRMREELQSALDTLDHEDRSAYARHVLRDPARQLRSVATSPKLEYLGDADEEAAVPCLSLLWH